MDGPVLVFDGDCAFCTTTARWAAARLGERARVMSFQALGDDGLAALGLEPTQVQAAAWWVDRSGGRRERAARAVGRALLTIGGGYAVPGALALVPPTSWLAAGTYRLVARHRHRLPGGTPACRANTR